MTGRQRWGRPAIAVLALLAFASLAAAQQLVRIRYFDTQTVTNAAAQAICANVTACTGDVATAQAFLTVEANAIRWRADGTAPTTTVGHLATAGATITIQGHANVANFRMIATAANATVQASVSRP